MKITGSSSTFCPLLPVDDALIAPEPCLSQEVKLEPIDSTLFPTLPEESDDVLNDEHCDEFGEFLLDAVNWL